jgi:hypothetical protein
MMGSVMPSTCGARLAVTLVPRRYSEESAIDGKDETWDCMRMTVFRACIPSSFSPTGVSIHPTILVISNSHTSILVYPCPQL